MKERKGKVDETLDIPLMYLQHRVLYPVVFRLSVFHGMNLMTENFDV